MIKRTKPNPKDPAIQDLLPDNSTVFGDQPFIDNEALEEAAQQRVIKDDEDRLERNKSARELAAEMRQKRIDLMTPEDKARHEILQARRYKAEQDKIPELKAEEAPHFKNVPGMVNVSAKGTTIAGVQKLLNGMGINLEIQFSRTDTMNLLATLLTCNEAQLLALYSDNRVPVVIKTVIKRLLDDSKVGSMEAIEKIWDRIFGKAGMIVDLPQGNSAMPGVLPNQPVSREAYIIIREHLMGKDN